MKVACPGSYPLGDPRVRGSHVPVYPAARVTINVDAGATPESLEKPPNEVESSCPESDAGAGATPISVFF
jgi:hypothetical protein